jgi:hypothetical protein
MVRNGPGMAIMALQWRIRYAWIMLRKLEWFSGWLFCWQASGEALNDCYLEDDMTPEEAVDTELSYWTD